MKEVTIHQYEADHDLSFFERGTAFELLDRLGLHEALGDVANRRAFFAGLNDEHYKQFVGYINSKTRGEVATYDYADGKLPMTDTPPLNHKETLMNSTFRTAREILADDNLEDRQALLRAGLTMAGAINLIHPFLNGNGRTGRVMDYLIQYGTERRQKIFEDEMRAIIAGTPAYADERERVIFDTPPPEIDTTLNELAGPKIEAARNQGFKVSKRGAASYRILEFLEVVSGKQEGLLGREAVLYDQTFFKPGEHDIIELYEVEYFNKSTAPKHADINPDDKQRVILEPKVETELDRRLAAMARAMVDDVV